MSERKTLFSLLIITFILIGLLVIPSAKEVQAVKAVSASTTTVQLQERSLQFQLHTPSLQIDESGHVTVAQLEQTIAEAGAPALPYYATLIALPPGADVEVVVRTAEKRTHTQVDVASVPQVTAQYTDSYFRTAADLIQTPYQDAAVYTVDALYPDTSYTVSEPMQWRDLRVVQLKLYPVRYNPVQKTLYHDTIMQVSVHFTGDIQTVLPTTLSETSTLQTGPFILNGEQAVNWRTLPSQVNVPNNVLPIGTDTYKIEVDTDGLYDISYADLAATGMDVDNVDPATLEMMHRGQSVSYQFIGDGDSQFEAGEKIRFYGWAFDGSRIEKQHVINNIFWVWANGSASQVVTSTNPITYPVATGFSESITREPEKMWFASWSHTWELYPNEPDALYWTRIEATNSAPLTNTYAITLLHPVLSGPDAIYTVELMGQSNSLRKTTIHPPGPDSNSITWFGNENRNFTGTIPITDLVSGPNLFQIVLDNIASLPDSIFLNRITVDYQRQTKAVNDQLILRDDGGQRTFRVTDFSQDGAIVWNISDRYTPVAIPVQVTGNGLYTYTFGSSDPTGETAAFIAADVSTIQSPLSISQYTPTDLDPVGGADWVAVAYGDFMTTTQTLATHRQQALYGGLKTHVADVQDVINQYGHGLPIPQAINDYLLHGLMTWTTPPSYALMVGDATTNPRQLVLLPIVEGGDPSLENGDPDLVPTHLLFIDRFQGQIPSDTEFALLLGDDLLPDIGIGRLPAQSTTELGYMVDKIIQFELNQLTPADWMEHLIFVADNDDNGGNFCDENQEVGDLLPDNFAQTYLCLATDDKTETNALRDKMYETIDITGTLILNYRGHGSIDQWASPAITKYNHVGRWQNMGEPVMLLSADCLDGYFSLPGTTGLGESFLSIENAGTAAHWSSSGLGYSFEHTVLHRGFYQALFDHNITKLGDMITYSKIEYLNGGYDSSEARAFTLLGDPAMYFMRPDVSLEKTTAQADMNPGDTVTFTLTVQNDGIYPSDLTITDTLPVGMSYVSATASVTMTTVITGNIITFTFSDDLAWQETILITLTAQISPTYTGLALNNLAETTGTGEDLNLSNQTDTALVTMDGCNGIAPTAPDVSGQQVSNGWQLMWADSPLNVGYGIYRDTDPYLNSKSLLETIGAGSGNYVDETAVSGQNYYYQVEAQNCDSSQVATSATEGVFHFNLTPGD